MTLAPQAGASPAHRPRRRRRRILLILVAALAVLLVAAEFAARILVGRITADQITRRLPENVSAQVSVSPTGACVLCELVTRRISGLALSTSDLQVGDVNGQVTATVRGVSLANPIEIAGATGEIRVGADEVNKLIRDAASDAGIAVGDLQFSDGKVSYATDLEVFGQPITVAVDARVRIRSGGFIRIEATDLRLQSGDFSGGMDASSQLVSFDVCIDEYLPELLQITRVEVSDAGLAIGVRSRHAFAATEQQLTALGACRKR